MIATAGRRRRPGDGRRVARGVVLGAVVLIGLSGPLFVTSLLVGAQPARVGPAEAARVAGGAAVGGAVAAGTAVPGGATTLVQLAPVTTDRDDERVAQLLRRADEEVDRRAHHGQVTVVSFGADGPRIGRFEMTVGQDGVRFARDNGDEVGRVADQAFWRSSSRLLRVGGVEPLPLQLDRLRQKYAARVLDRTRLDTGPAEVIALHERGTGVAREILYLDVDSGLVVRRETFDRAGAPVRTVAYTRLDVIEATPEQPVLRMPSGVGLETTDHEHVVVAADPLRAQGFTVPPTLPGGYELMVAVPVPEANVPTLHLLYGDGLYTLSVFQQQGRLRPAARDGAAQMTTAAGGAVWRWPGSEPRRVVWVGADSTYTALADAPLDELVEALAGLPVDPPPSILDRLGRGLARLIGTFPIPWSST